MAIAEWTPQYEKWRHGGWYVSNIKYPKGGCGCVSNNYPDKKWRIVCGPQDVTFASRDAAAKAEYVAVQARIEEYNKTGLPGSAQPAIA